MFSSRTTEAAVVPERIDPPAQALAVIEADGAAVVGGIHTEEQALAFASKVLGDKLIRLGRQFEASMRNHEREAAVVDAQPVDGRGRKRSFGNPGERMTAHNDGFAFGDYAPDYLFLWCKRPAESGGDSFLVFRRPRGGGRGTFAPVSNAPRPPC